MQACTRCTWIPTGEVEQGDMQFDPGRREGTTPEGYNARGIQRRRNTILEGYDNASTSRLDTQLWVRILVQFFFHLHN